MTCQGRSLRKPLRHKGLPESSGEGPSAARKPTPKCGFGGDLLIVGRGTVFGRTPGIHYTSDRSPASDLEVRMTEREDVQDIHDLLVRYATGIDRRDWALFRTVFTPDCELDYGEIGQWHDIDAVTGFMDRIHLGYRYTLHRMTNMVITVNGDRAEARTYVDALIVTADMSGVNAIGYYDDDVVRTDDGWRIARRRLTKVWEGPVGKI